MEDEVSKRPSARRSRTHCPCQVYGGEVPEEAADMEGKEGEEDTAVRISRDSLPGSLRSHAPPASQELEAMKARLKEMEEEAAKLRAMQARRTEGASLPAPDARLLG